MYFCVALCENSFCGPESQLIRAEPWFECRDSIGSHATFISKEASDRGQWGVLCCSHELRWRLTSISMPTGIKAATMPYSIFMTSSLSRSPLTTMSKKGKYLMFPSCGTKLSYQNYIHYHCGIDAEVEFWVHRGVKVGTLEVSVEHWILNQVLA